MPSDDRAERGERAPALQARFDDAVDEHHLADRQRQRAGEVEARARRARAALGDDRVGDERGGDRDRRVDQQHPAPAEHFGDDRRRAARRPRRRAPFIAAHVPIARLQLRARAGTRR